MKLLNLALLLLTSLTVALAQQPQTPKAEVQTKVEIFQARTGVVLLKNFTEIASLNTLGGTVTITSWEFIDAQTAKREYGISIEIKESGRLSREARSFVDYDEIESLLNGIDYVSKATTGKLKNFEAVFRTKGDLEVSVFSDTDGIQSAVSVGRVSRLSVYFKLAALGDFRKSVVDARAALDAIRPVRP